MPLKVLIIGAGVCGPAFATMLRRTDPDVQRYEITVIERAPKLRESGLQIDIRAQGISVVRKMGLIDTLRKRSVPEPGVSWVDGQGQSFATFGKNDSGHGAQAMTSEYEVMRGDLVDIFYRTSLGLNPEDKTKNTAVEHVGAGVRYEFGTTVTDISQQGDEAVSVTFSNGKRGTYDLVVGADGQSSRTRRAVFNPSDTSFHPLGLYTAYYLIPRTAQDDGWMTWHQVPGRRGVVTRSAESTKPTQVYMSVKTSRAEDAYGVVSAVLKSPFSSPTAIAEQKETFAAAFDNTPSWRVPELVDALRNRTSDDDFYATEIAQVKCEKLVSGRVVLLGDAGYCPAPVTGMGTTLSLTGAYILAGELSRHAEGDVPAALKAYEENVRPYVKEAQKLAPGNPGAIFAETAWGVWFVATFVWLMAKLRVVDIAFRLMPEDKGGLKIPEYPELSLEG